MSRFTIFETSKSADEKKGKEERKKEQSVRLVGDDFCDRLELGKKWANERERKRKKINEKQKDDEEQSTESRNEIRHWEGRGKLGRNQDEKRKGQVVRIARQIADVESERGWQDAKGR